MKMNRQVNTLSLIVCIVLIAAMALFTIGCGAKTADSPANVPQGSAGGALGTGNTKFTFTVKDIEGEEVSFEISTDKKTVGEALTELKLIDGDIGDYGLYVKSVNGIRHEFTEDGKYWAFYVNDAYAEKGCDLTEIENGAVYSFRAE